VTFLQKNKTKKLIEPIGKTFVLSAFSLTRHVVVVAERRSHDIDDVHGETD
jgi:hypothetical protein